jgi:hypothetical protein
MPKQANTSASLLVLMTVLSLALAFVGVGAFAQGSPSSSTTDEPAHPAIAPSAPTPTATSTRQQPSSGDPSTRPDTEISKAIHDTKEINETKETKETTQVKEQPHFLVGLINVIAWPLTVIFLFVALARNITLADLKELLGIAKPILNKIKIGGVELEFNLEALRKRGEQTRESFLDLVARADNEYQIASAQQEVKAQLAVVLREALPQVLAANNLPVDPPVRATIHVSDIVFDKYLYQLTEYFPDPASGGKVGRRFSQRFGIIGRAWRMNKSMARENAVASPENAVQQLIEHWGMTYEEATKSRARQSPADLCVILRSEDEGNLPIGLLFIDSPNKGAFGSDQPSAPQMSQANIVASQLENAEQVRVLARAVTRTMVPLRTGTPRIQIE